MAALLGQYRRGGQEVCQERRPPGGRSPRRREAREEKGENAESSNEEDRRQPALCCSPSRLSVPDSRFRRPLRATGRAADKTLCYWWDERLLFKHWECSNDRPG